MEHLIAEHEAVRDFVQRETGGFVEKIEANSISEYAPTLDSLVEVKADKASRVFIDRFTVRHKITENPDFIPTKYDVEYKVTVVYPPGDKYTECSVKWVGDNYMIVVRRTGYRW